MILEEPAKESEMDWTERKKENQDSSVTVAERRKCFEEFTV